MPQTCNAEHHVPVRIVCAPKVVVIVGTSARPPPVSRPNRLAKFAPAIRDAFGPRQHDCTSWIAPDLRAVFGVGLGAVVNRQSSIWPM